MELLPALELGWLNGWLLIGLLYLTYIIVLIILPKDVVARLYDRSGRSKRRKVAIYAGSFFAFVYFGLIIFTPLKIGSAVFIPGIILYLLGLAGFVVALFNFKSAPPNQPITTGLYRLSRHPQQLMFFHFHWYLYGHRLLACAIHTSRILGIPSLQNSGGGESLPGAVW